MIGNALFARNFLAPNVRNFVNDRMVSETEKAQRLVDTMTDRIQHFPDSFNDFIDVLEKEGPWTSDMVKELRDLCRDKSECVVKPSLNKKLSKRVTVIPVIISGQPKSTDGQPGFVCPYCRECSI